MEDKNTKIAKAATEALVPLFSFFVLLFMLVATPLFGTMLSKGDGIIRTVATGMIIILVLVMVTLLVVAVVKLTWLFMIATGRDDSEEGRKVLNVCEVIHIFTSNGITIFMGLVIGIFAVLGIINGPASMKEDEVMGLYIVCGIFVVSGIVMVIAGIRSIVKRLKNRKKAE
ncbi:MAG: hypothetical protein IKO30_03315 [Lachnospiraceae bacterium]|nr:hypothetical protein [Lachnospiraceae bacterium]